MKARVKTRFAKIFVVAIIVVAVTVGAAPGSASAQLSPEVASSIRAQIQEISAKIAVIQLQIEAISGNAPSTPAVAGATDLNEKTQTASILNLLQSIINQLPAAFGL